MVDQYGVTGCQIVLGFDHREKYMFREAVLASTKRLPKYKIQFFVISGVVFA
jgi:hypothetical protein